MKIRELQENDVEFKIQIEAEFDNPKKSDFDWSDEHFEKFASQVRTRIESGDLWAWCNVVVSAHWNGFSGQDSLGLCSYKNEADFKIDGHFADMKKTSLEELNQKIKNSFEELQTLIE